MSATVIEADPHTALRHELDSARDNLGRLLLDPGLPTEGYETGMVHYLDAFQAVHFDPANSSDREFAHFRDVACRVKNEVELIVGYSIESPFEVETRLLGYFTDDVAAYLRGLEISAMPRAMTMTLLDLMDAYR